MLNIIRYYKTEGTNKEASAKVYPGEAGMKKNEKASTSRSLANYSQKWGGSQIEGEGR
jgi:hypothetical protein